ncbi:MAG: hypothetical protein ABI863_16515 [Ginsengibacter sp.]
MKSLIRKILLGDTEIKEYSTITIEGQIKESVFLETGNFTIDVSKIHWLLCLEPIVFGIWLNNDGHKIFLGDETKYQLYFSGSPGNDFKIAKRNAVAIITLDYFDKIEEANGTLYLLKLTHCKIHHVSFLKTWLLFFKYYKKPKLSFEKYKSLVAAYSYPRRVRIISFKLDDYFNIFPMDLLGEIPASGKYVFGLRHTNATLSKIIETKKIVVSEVPYVYKDIIYELGRHHGSAPPSPGSLPFKIMQTESFGFLIPEWADGYKEIQILKTKDLGSHMLLWGEIINGKTLKQSSGNLYHIHFLLYYYQKLKRVDYPVV